MEARKTQLLLCRKKGTISLAAIETFGFEYIRLYFLIEKGLTDSHRGNHHEGAMRHLGGHHFWLDNLMRAERIDLPQFCLFLIEQILKMFLGMVEFM